MIAAIVQARMGSTRLRGKVLKDIVGNPLLWHIWNRLCRAKTLDNIIVATTDKLQDDPIVSLCKKAGVHFFRGSEDDVLDRYYTTARYFDADIIVRITADCPLIDPEVVDKVVGVFLKGGRDYCSNIKKRTYPDGLDTEVFSFRALEKAWREAKLMSEREHVTPYIHKHSELFRLGDVTQDRDLSHLRWVVDEPRDLEFVRKVYEHLYRPGEIFLMEDVVRLLEKNPELVEINKGIMINEGYFRSLKSDQIIGSPTNKVRNNSDNDG